MVPINIEVNKFNKIKEEYKQKIIDSFKKPCWEEISGRIDEELISFGIKESLEDILIVDFTTLKNIKNKFDSQGRVFEKYKCKDKHDENKYVVDSIYNELYKKYNSLDKIGLIQNLGITVCPYCNRSFINNRNKSTTAQLDHFYPRSKYPIFSLSICNLIPSCYGCNHIKRENEIGASPYDSNINFADEVKFSYTPEDVEFLDDINKLELTLESTNDNIEKNIEVMKIKDAYELNKDYVFELIKKSKIYNDDFKNELLNNYSDLISSEDELNRLLYGNYLNVEDYNKRPLSKLTHDILLELGIIS